MQSAPGQTNTDSVPLVTPSCRTTALIQPTHFAGNLLLRPRSIPIRLTDRAELGEIAHMTTLVKADSRGRVPIRGTKSRQQYLVIAEKGGWWVMPAPKTKIPSRELEDVVADTWKKLGPAPEIDDDKI